MTDELITLMLILYCSVRQVGLLQPGLRGIGFNNAGNKSTMGTVFCHGGKNVLQETAVDCRLGFMHTRSVKKMLIITNFCQRLAVLKADLQ